MQNHLMFKYIETDPIILLNRAKNYEIHKSKIRTAEKIIDNSSPSTVRLGKYISRTPVNTYDISSGNSRIYHRLNEIYNRPMKHPKTLVSIKTSPLINRNRQAVRIASENQLIAKKLVEKKATVCAKELEDKFKTVKEFREMISKVSRVKKNERLLKRALNLS